MSLIDPIADAACFAAAGNDVANLVGLLILPGDEELMSVNIARILQELLLRSKFIIICILISVRCVTSSKSSVMIASLSPESHLHTSRRQNLELTTELEIIYWILLEKKTVSLQLSNPIVPAFMVFWQQELEDSMQKSWI
jgi:hypothetical protein